MEPVATDIGPDPIPNNALPPLPTLFYNCPPTFDAAEYVRTHGFDIQTGFNRDVTSILRPDLSRWDHIEDEEVRHQCKAGDISKQQQAIAYFAGELSFERFASVLSPWFNQHLGCIVIPDLRDLGA